MTRDQGPTPTVEAIGRLHLEGNIIPHSFFTRREFKSDRGVTQHLSIMIYADDLYWYRPTYHRDEMTGQVLRVTRKFAADKLQRDYAYYANLLGISKVQATAAVKFLVDRGLITREFRTVTGNNGRPIPNVMFVEPVPEALEVLLKPDGPGAPGWFWTAELPRPNVKKGQTSPVPRPVLEATEDTALPVPGAAPVEGGVSTIEGIRIPNRMDTLCRIEGIRIPNRMDTNTEISSETSLEISSRGGGSASGDARLVPAPHSSSGSAERQPPEGLPLPVTLEGGPEPHAEDLPFLDGPVVPVDPAELDAVLTRLTSPDGAAADAVSGPAWRIQVAAQSLSAGGSQATSTETVPGGGAARAAEPQGLPTVPMATLLARPVARPESQAYRALRALMGKNLPVMLGEKTRTGQLDRALWLRLEEGEISLVRERAQAEVRAGQGLNLITQAARGLDHLIGAVRAEAPAASPTHPVHLDPELAAGQRCMVRDPDGTEALGVVQEVNAARYRIRLDDGNQPQIDRSVAAQLRTLRASDAPAPAAEAGTAPLVPAGTTWRRLKGKTGHPGEVVTVQAIHGMKRTLSSGAELPVYIITRDFEQLG